MTEFLHGRPNITGIDVELWRRELGQHDNLHHALRTFERDSDDYAHYMLEARRQLIEQRAPDIAWVRHVADEYFDSFRRIGSFVIATDGQAAPLALVGLVSAADRRQCDAYNPILRSMGEPPIAAAHPELVWQDMEPRLLGIHVDQPVEAAAVTLALFSQSNLTSLLSETFDN